MIFLVRNSLFNCFYQTNHLKRLLRRVPASTSGIQLPQQSSKPSSAIQKAMEATLASIELPPPPKKEEKPCVYNDLKFTIPPIITIGKPCVVICIFMYFFCFLREVPKEDKEEKKEIIQFKNKKEAIEAFKMLLKDKVNIPEVQNL